MQRRKSAPLETTSGLPVTRPESELANLAGERKRLFTTIVIGNGRNAESHIRVVLAEARVTYAKPGPNSEFLLPRLLQS